MSEFGRTLAKLTAKSDGAKIIHGDNLILNPLMEWNKWLSYETKEERERKDLLNHLKPNELTEDQLIELQYYKMQERLSQLFIKYDQGNCTQDEYLEVYDYTVKHSIMDLMIRKLTKQELVEAYQIIENCKLLSREELMDIRDNYKQDENYATLSHFDAFVLHVLCDMCSRLAHEKCVVEIASQKRLINDANDYKTLI